MVKIVLLCAGGASTSILVKKMKEVAKEEGFECEISAHGVSEAVELGKEADCILLGPQVGYQKKKVQEECPSVPVDAIDMMAYGAMNAKKVLSQAKNMMGV